MRTNPFLPLSLAYLEVILWTKRGALGLEKLVICRRNSVQETFILIKIIEQFWCRDSFPTGSVHVSKIKEALQLSVMESEL